MDEARMARFGTAVSEAMQATFKRDYLTAALKWREACQAHDDEQIRFVCAKTGLRVLAHCPESASGSASSSSIRLVHSTSRLVS